MRLYVDLSPTEQANIAGWVNKGLADPQFAAYPWRIVLEERTQARFDQIAVQFGAPPAALPVDVQPEIPYGDFSRKLFAASVGVVTAFPFHVPVGPFIGANGSLLRMAAAEFQGQPWGRLLSVSATAGDLRGFLTCGGKAPDVFGRVGVEFVPGALLYANMVLTEDPIPGSSGSGFSIVWPQI